MDTLIAPDLPMTELLARVGETARAVKPGKTYPCGRTCERWDCITILSIYNKGPTCWTHAHDEFRPRRSAA